MGLFDLSHQQAATEMVLDESIEADFKFCRGRSFLGRPYRAEMILVRLPGASPRLVWCCTFGASEWRLRHF